MPDSPTRSHLIDRLKSMDKDEAIASIKLIQTLPQGKQATEKFAKTLVPEAKKDRKKMKYVLGFFDGLNTALEAVTSLVYLLP